LFQAFPIPRSWLRSVVKIAPVVEVKTVPFFVHSNAPDAETALAVVVTVIGGALIVAVGVCLDEDMCEDPRRPPTTAIAAMSAMIKARSSQKARIGMPHSFLRFCLGGPSVYCSCLLNYEEPGPCCGKEWLCCW
jgi:hypothetical protein